MGSFEWRGTALLLTTLMTAFTPAVRADDGTPGTYAPSFAKTVEQLRMGGSHAGDVANLEKLAQLGDARAQVLVGGIYIEGKYVPQDKVKGYAWLQVAAQPSGNGYFTQGSREKALALIHEAESMLTPEERSQAEHIAADFITDRARRQKDGVDRAERIFIRPQSTLVESMVEIPAGSVVLTPLTGSSDDPLYRVGCAAETAAGCPPESVLKGPHCTGRLGVPASDQTPVDQVSPRVTQPEYPTDAQARGVDGTVTLLAHVDSSGWMCAVVLAVSSGTPSLDQAAVETAAQWRLRPATNAGRPVEGLYPFQVTFKLNGYNIK